MAVADEIVAELEPVLQGYAREFGLPGEIASTLRLHWNGASYGVQTTADLGVHEYGDGKGPAPRPVFKAMNRLHADIEQRLQDRLLAEAASTVSPW